MQIRVLAGLLAALTLRAADVQLEAGVARVEITPSSFMQMYGYSNRKCGPANGTHDPLHAKVLLLAASHTHSAPAFLPPSASPSGAASPPAEPSAYLSEIEQKIFDAIQKA